MGEVLNQLEIDEKGVVQSGVRKTTFEKYNADSDDLSGALT